MKNIQSLITVLYLLSHFLHLVDNLLILTLCLVEDPYAKDTTEDGTCQTRPHKDFQQFLTARVCANCLSNAFIVVLF